MKAAAAIASFPFSVAFSGLVSLPGSLSAQNAPEVRGSITGIAVDSIRGGYLRDALVMLVNSKRTTVTDSVGQFRIDSVDPGSYTLRLSHPILDTVGVGVATRPFEVRPNEVTSFILAVPSPATIVARKCSETERQLGGAALAGVVLDADTEMPSAGSEVIVAWTDYEVGTKSVSSAPRRRSATVGADGSFIVCGIPVDLATGVLARRGTDSTALVPTSFANVLAVQSFHLPAAGDNAVSAANSTGSSTPATLRGVAVLRGKVVDASNRPVKGARVAVEEDTAVTVSADDGQYYLAGLRAGTRMVTVRRIGFEPIEKVVELRSASPAEVSITLSKFVPVLETVRITALRTIGLDRVGFAARQKLGSGKYLSPELLDRWNNPRINDALRMVPFLRMGRTSTGESYVTGRFGDCVRYFVDGHKWSERGEGPDTFLGGPEIGAIEVYTPQFSPPEFMSYSSDGQPCASVVIWTKWKLRIK